MRLKTNHLFRQEALDRLNSPEHLDQVMQVVKPRAWLSLFATGALIAATGFWGVFGRIPLTVTGQGILIKPRQVVQFQTSSAGQLVALTIQPGDVVKLGEVIGIIDQSALQQQLQQARAKLAELENQNQATDQLTQQRLTQELENLQQQRHNLEKTLQRERSALSLWQQTQGAIAEKRTSLESRRQQVSMLLQTLQERVASRRQLLEQQIISRDMLVQAEQEYFNTQAQISDIDVQLKDLDIQTANAQQDYLHRLNTIDNLQTQLYTLTTQETKLREQAFRESTDRTNEIQDLKRQIEQLQLQLTTSGRIISQYHGRVLEVSLVPGQYVSPGTRIGAIEIENSTAELVSYVYLNNPDGKQVQPGMAVQVTPGFVKREQYGGMVGRVTEVSAFPITPDDIAVTVGNPDIAKTLTTNGQAMIQAVAQLEKDPTTASGYRWSSSEGPSLQISSGTIVSVRVRVGEQAPIAYVLPTLRRWTGLGG